MRDQTTRLAMMMGALLAFPVLAAEREHGAHEHGAAALNLVLDGSELAIELVSPAANLVGFEHVPQNEAEREALARTLTELRAGETLFVIPAGAGCRLIEAEVETPLADAGEHDGLHEHEGHPDHKSHEEEYTGHADLTAHYHFDCARPNALERINVRLFSAFPGTERLSVQFVGPGGQGATELTGENSTLRLR